MKRLGSVLFLPLLFLVFVLTRPASAEEAEATCDPADAAQISAVFNGDGSEATFTVENALPLCDPVAIGQAVYLKDADGLVFPQTLYTSTADTITSGSKTLTVQLPQTSQSPSCFTQVDAFVGPVIQDLREDNMYGGRLRAYLWSTVPECDEVLAESTTTSTTTTSTTTTTTTSTTTTTLPTGPGTSISEPPTDEEVLPLEVSRQEPIVAPALARTGPGDGTNLLLGFAGSLLVAGGFSIALANRRTALR